MLTDKKIMHSDGYFTPENLVHLRQKSFIFKKNPSKIRKSRFVLKSLVSFAGDLEQPLDDLYRLD